MAEIHLLPATLRNYSLFNVATVMSLMLMCILPVISLLCLSKFSCYYAQVNKLSRLLSDKEKKLATQHFLETN